MPDLTDAEVASRVRAAQMPTDDSVERLTDAQVVGQYPVADNALRTMHAEYTAPRGAALVTAQREAARKALAEVMADTHGWPISEAYAMTARANLAYFTTRYLAREYPLPSPPSVTLCDNSVVTFEIKMGEPRWMRRYPEGHDTLPRRMESTEWTSIFNPSDCGLDFDTMRRFAESVATPEAR